MTRKLALLAVGAALHYTVQGAALLAAPGACAQRRGAACCALFLAQAPSPAQQPAPAQQPPPQAAPAQQPAAPPEQGAPLSKLGLSDEQKKQIHKIRRDAEEQVQAIKKDTSLTEQQQTTQIRQVRRNQIQQVDEVLTPEQREKYDAWRKSHLRRHRPPPQQPPANPAGA